MGYSLWSLLRQMDDFGHPMNLTFKGEVTYQTLIGGFLSIVVQVLTLVKIIQAGIEIYSVQEPKITSFKRFLSLSERE